MKVLAVALALLSWSVCLHAGDVAAGKKLDPKYDGVWWEETEEKERSGFLDGASDCLTWTAHEKGFNATSAQLAPELDRFYQTHPKQKKLPLLAAWRRVEPEMASKAVKQEAETHGAGEDWRNAHWYLNGEWWAGAYPNQKLGFVEGHLWCARTHVKALVYSRPAAYYVGKIDDYYTKHNDAIETAIADVLARFRERRAAANAK